MTGVELLEILCDVARELPPTAGMSSDVVRFALEYDAPQDVATEKVRVARKLHCEGFSLRAFPGPATGQLARFLVLEFGARRTMSSHALFEMAGALRERLQVTGVEPDVSDPIFFEPDPAVLPGSESESAIVDLWCRSNAAPPPDHLWALRAIRADKAWPLTGAPGRGVLIAQPDTGVAAHSELEDGMLALDKAANILEGGRDPTDPLKPSMANPGHGTSTASVAASRRVGTVTGAAPEARVIPIRCIDDVKIFNGAPVAAAVSHARSVGADIVTMSLGGLYSRSLAAAIDDAVGAGLIVLAAAGNCVGFVVYPASDPEVIGIAGVDAGDMPWRGSSRGTEVAVSAPAENVYVARRQPGDSDTTGVSAGQGTSFAVALVAGTAAMWLAHHGRDAVRKEAARRRLSVQTLFRRALRQTARVPARWSPAKYGAGIVDAEALLMLALREIAGAATPEPARPDTQVGEVFRFAAEGAVRDGFDWRVHGAEATLLAAEAEIISRRASAGYEPVGGGWLRPSSRLLKTAPPLLRSILGETGPVSRGRVATTAPRTDTELLLRLVGKSVGGGLESTASVNSAEAQSRLRNGHRDVLMGKLSGALERGKRMGGLEANNASELAANADRGLEKLAKSGADARLTAGERIGLEALVSIHDRPALRVRDGEIDIDDPLVGDWVAALASEARLTAALKSVGRIDLDGVHVGTGWVLAPGLIMTNRHVLEEVGEEFRTAAGKMKWALTGAVTIAFSDDGRGDGLRFAIKGVIAAGPDRIARSVNFAHLDMAVLEVETTNAARARLPKPLKLICDPDLLEKGSSIIVAGYPARPGAAAVRDPDTGAIRRDVIKRLQEIFGLDYSVKYLSPGEIGALPGELPDDARRWAMSHDATTLGGNSGSWVIYLGEPFGVVGLHFGGGTLRANFAHSIGAARDSKLLGPDAFQGAICF